MRVFEAEAAVGFASLIITPSRADEEMVLCAGAIDAASPRARARDALVGAYIPEAGVLGRVGAIGVGVFVRIESIFGVFARAASGLFAPARARAAVVELEVPVFCALRGLATGAPLLGVGGVDLD